MKGYIKELAKAIGVEVGEKFYLCHYDWLCNCEGEYFLDEDDALVRVYADGNRYGNGYELNNLLVGRFVACKFNEEKGYQVIGGAC